MSTFGVCPFCGWLLTHEGLRSNGGVPYCCGDYEQQGVVLWE
jgi:hypothetical protein